MEGKYIAWYLIFLALVSAIGFFGASTFDTDIEALPTIPEDAGLLDQVVFAFEIAGFFFFLGGLSVIGLPSQIIVLIGFVLNGIMLYVATRLIRGGG